MKNAVLLLIILAAAAWTTFWIVETSEIRPIDTGGKRKFFSQSGMSLGQYAQSIIDTHSYADPETWRRVNAVRSLETRLKDIDESHLRKGYR